MKAKVLRWIGAAGVRALKTVAQTALAILSTSMLISEVDWPSLISATIMAGLLSLLTSLGGLPELKDNEGGTNENN